MQHKLTIYDKKKTVWLIDIHFNKDIFCFIGEISCYWPPQKNWQSKLIELNRRWINENINIIGHVPNRTIETKWNDKFHFVYSRFNQMMIENILEKSKCSRLSC